MVMRRRAKASKKSSAGPDGWLNQQLARLPQTWFELLAQLVNHILDKKLSMPQAWKHVNVSLIPRPISIASSIWRLVGVAIFIEMNEWASSIMPPEVVGGVKRGVRSMTY